MKFVRVLSLILLLGSCQFCLAELSKQDVSIRKISSAEIVNYEECELLGASISADNRIAMLLKRNRFERLVVLMGSDGTIKYRYRLELADSNIFRRVTIEEIYFDRFGGLHCLFEPNRWKNDDRSIIIDFFEDRAVARVENIRSYIIKGQLSEYTFMVGGYVGGNWHNQSTLRYQRIQPYILTVESEKNGIMELFYSDRLYRSAKKEAILEPILTGVFCILIFAMLLRYKFLEKRNRSY